MQISKLGDQLWHFEKSNGHNTYVTCLIRAAARRQDPGCEYLQIDCIARNGGPHGGLPKGKNPKSPNDEEHCDKNSMDGSIRSPYQP